MDAIFSNLENPQSFNRESFLESIRKSGKDISESSFKLLLTKLLKEGTIARSGRNSYYLASEKKKQYSYLYSEYAAEIAAKIKEMSFDLNFVIIEASSLNEFLNHLIGKNTVFVYVENGCEDFVFNLLNEDYPGKVLIKPNGEVFNQYWTENMIIIQKLVSEAPLKADCNWSIRIEKLIVDLYADKLLKSIFQSSELPAVYEQMFKKYLVDESALFRYARRRKTEESLLSFIKEKTQVKLKTR